MSKLDNFIDNLDIRKRVTQEDIQKTKQLLDVYGVVLRQSARRIGEMELECYENRRQSIAEFIDLAVDYDHEQDRKRIAERLCDMGHNMQLLELLDEALVLTKDYPHVGEMYYRILQARFFDAYCRSNEDAFLNANVSSSTYYRNIKPAIQLFAAMLWCVVIPDYIIAEQQGGKLPVVPPSKLIDNWHESRMTVQ